MRKRTDEELHVEALKYKKRGAFRKGSSGAYQAACNKGKAFLDKICSHMEPSESEPYEDEEIRQEAKKYKRRADFSKFSPSHYNAAWRKGKDYLDEICSHM